ncbi:hypothetical protein [Nocardiopsis trehalosi]|uniref:hypothetical protein n=1 Tax=Nocardiopsis trehalosi TaxID=109329 RepID=UPI000AC1835A|nr:hypothetical protein [Nocardiopsis trehalosi]
MTDQGSYIALDASWTEDPWFRFPRAFIRDASLSATARAAAAWMASHSTSFRFDVPAMVRAGLGGRDVIRRGLRQLEDRGYLVRTRERLPDGTLGRIDYRLYPVPQPRPEPEPAPEPAPENQSLDLTCENTAFPQVSTSDWKPGPGFQGGSKREHLKEEQENNSSPPLPSSPAAEPAQPAGREDEAPPPEDDALKRAQSLVDAAVRRWPSHHRAPGPRDRQRLSERVARELAAGGDEATITDELTRDLNDAGSAVRVLLGARTRTPGWGRPADPRPDPARFTVTGPKPAWCGRCDERTRLVMAIRDDGSEAMRRCRDCHPAADPLAAL